MQGVYLELRSHCELKAFNSVGMFGSFYKHYNARFGRDNTPTLRYYLWDVYSEYLLKMYTQNNICCQSRLEHLFVVSRVEPFTLPDAFQS